MEEKLFEIIDYLMNINVTIVYMFFFFSSFMQMVFPPYPGDTILVFQGYISSLSDQYRFIIILANSMTATILGALTVYYVGYYKGEDIFKYRIIKKYIGVTQKRRTKKILDKFGPYAIFVSKFAPGVSSLSILLAGVFRIKKSVVYISILLSTIAHTLALLVLGLLIGENMSRIRTILSTYNMIILFVLIAVIAIYLIYKKLFAKR